MTAAVEAAIQAEVERLWSVTTLIKHGLGTGEGLVRWSVRQPCEIAYDRFATLASFHESGDREGAIKWLMEARWNRTKKAMARGTELHAIAEELALGGSPVIPEGAAPYIDQYRRWLDRYQPEFLMAEAPVYNLTERYAGTCDGLMRLPSFGPEPIVFDYKTTEYAPDGEKARPPWPEVALQLAAYARAEVVGVISEQRYASGKRYYVYDPAKQHEAMPKVEHAVCIVISPYDCVAVPTRIDESVWTTFLYVRECARFRLSADGGLFGPPLSPPPEEVPNGT